MNKLPGTLWQFNIAIENGPFIADLPILLKIVIFHSYVSLPEGRPCVHRIYHASVWRRSDGMKNGILLKFSHFARALLYASPWVKMMWMLYNVGPPR
jgi:hypothetical protein